MSMDKVIEKHQKILDESRVTVPKDDGIKTTFSTGAQRDTRKGKGRYDLLPVCALLRYYNYHQESIIIFEREESLRTADQAIIYLFKYLAGHHDYDYLALAAYAVTGAAATEEYIEEYNCGVLPPLAIDRLAKRYEFGCDLYGDRNWEKGQPISVLIDSALRHLFMYIDDHINEDHLAAAMWNIFGAMFMEIKHPDQQNIPARCQSKDPEAFAREYVTYKVEESKHKEIMEGLIQENKELKSLVEQFDILIEGLKASKLLPGDFVKPYAYVLNKN